MLWGTDNYRAKKVEARREGTRARNKRDGLHSDRDQSPWRDNILCLLALVPRTGKQTRVGVVGPAARAALGSFSSKFGPRVTTLVIQFVYIASVFAERNMRGDARGNSGPRRT